MHSGLGPTKEGVPFIDVGGGFTIGNNFNGQLPQIGNTFQFSDNFSKIIGNHSLKFGGDVRYQKFDQLLYFDVNGDMQFLSSTSSPVGNDLGLRCLSRLSAGAQRIASSRARRSMNWCAARHYICSRRTAGRSNQT